MDFIKVIEESKSVNARDFIRLLESTITIIEDEQENNHNITITGKLAKLEAVGELLVIGDLHGSLESLTAIIEKSDFLNKMAKNKDSRIVFLGDYGDRGEQSPELYYCVLRLKKEFKNQIILLRGNHEGPTDLIASPHDLPKMLQRKFKKDWVPIYSKLREFFDHLYNAAYVKGKYLLIHGGLPTKIRSLQEIEEADKLHPEKTYLEELLWNDPDDEVIGALPSPRGAGNLFGEAITKEVLGRLAVKVLIRGHEVANKGFKINHNGKILTLFSCKGKPYYTTEGAYLDLPLSETVENTTQLIQFIHKF